MHNLLPPLDLHAHVSATVPADELEKLGAVVFAATRSLVEYETVMDRSDRVTVWGLGCHPAAPEALSAFSPRRFEALVETTAFVSEVGLDGRAPSPLEVQEGVFNEVLARLKRVPRIVSVHSSGATGRVIDVLDRHRVDGAILHWWRGSKAQTRRAIELGCWFSINLDGVRFPEQVTEIPLDRILTETDHPYGNRKSMALRQPGAVEDVEEALGEAFGLDPVSVRKQVWMNFVDLVSATGVSRLLPEPVQRMAGAARRM